MRFKQKTALLLASVMLVGSVGIMNMTEVRAKEPAANTFTLTVPADTKITKSGWNDIGNIEVSKVSIASGKKISVTIENGATGRSLVNTIDSNKKVGYEVKKGTSASNEAFGDSLDFTENGTQAIGADVEDFSKAEAGTYEDTITFTAKVKPAVSIVYDKINKSSYDAVGKLLSDDLGTPTTWTYDGVTYDVYNEFIPFTKYTSWNDAMGFVNALKEANYDGHSDWTLLSSEGMAKAWYSEYGSSVNRGDVGYLWSSEVAGGTVYGIDCSNGSKFGDSKSWTKYSYGFVVLRGSSDTPAPTAVTYPRAGKEALSSENLGIPTEWKYNDTTYQVYNAFIPSSSGSSWNDATGFVKALNDANYDGHNDWALLSSEGMAIAWYSEYKSSVNRGYVYMLWSSVGADGGEAYCGSYYGIDGKWVTQLKSNAKEDYGFVVLRETEAPEATGVEYELQGENAPEGKKLTSTALLESGDTSTFEYDGTIYTAYNGYISETAYANWQDAQDFVAALNAVELDGETGGWTLLTDVEMTYAWWGSTATENHSTTGVPLGKGTFNGVLRVWSGAVSDSQGCYWICNSAKSIAENGSAEADVKYTGWGTGDKDASSKIRGFVVLRGSANPPE